MDVWGPLLAIAAPIVSSIIAGFSYLYKQVIDLHEKHALCEKQTAILQGQIDLLNAEMERRGREAEALIVADHDGFVREWNPGATILFHWSQREALGKSIGILVPPESLQAHNEAWARVVAGRVPRRGPHVLVGVTKEGNKIPLTAWYSCWVASDGTTVYGATIHMRSENYEDTNP